MIPVLSVLLGLFLGQLPQIWENLPWGWIATCYHFFNTMFVDIFDFSWIQILFSKEIFDCVTILLFTRWNICLRRLCN